MTEFQVIYEYHQETEFTIIRPCEMLDVSRSGYYKWLNYEPLPEQNEWLMEEIKRIFNQMNGIYGYRRVTTYINRVHDTDYNKKRIRQLSLTVSVNGMITHWLWIH